MYFKGIHNIIVPVQKRKYYGLLKNVMGTRVFNKGRRPAKLAGYFTPTRRLL